MSLWKSCYFVYVLLELIKLITAIQYNTISVSDPTDCALLLPDPQYAANLLQTDSGGSVNCITYESIDRAYHAARKRIDIPKVEDEWKSEEVAAVGQLLLDVSQQLANEYELSLEDIEAGFSEIDISKTGINEICPVYLSSISCRAGKYRRFDGLCNNVEHPTWGATMTPFTRLLVPQFADNMSAPRISLAGKPLPSARIVSRTIHSDEGYHDHAGTVMLIAWGQFMDHDFTLMGTPLDSQNRNEPEECCGRPDHLKNPYCMEIEIPEDDYFYKKFHLKCQDFVRAFPAVKPNCKLGSRTPFNTLTSVIDGNTVYGVTDSHARQLRAGHGGLLKMNPAFSMYGLKDLLPMKVDVPDEGCTRTNSSQFCFLAGEIRVNEQLVLTCIHTLMAREHNRIATELAAINPHWDDEILYQEARRITIAEIQHITFNEFLPLILGKDVMTKYELLLTSEGYWNGYNTNSNPNILDAFSAAAFRFGHSLLPSAIERWSKAHKFIASKRLSELIRRPYDLYRAGVIDEYFIGLMNQVAQAMDDSVTQEVTNHLLKKPGSRFGMDLVSFNIQRGRDFGLPGYMFYRKYCGLQTADTFEEMYGTMPNSTVQRYMSIYEDPWDIDLWSGGVSEKPLPGSMVGPTFACIIATQMNLIRKGDRFWYELPDQPSSFTLGQLQAIRKIKLSRVICDNTDLIDSAQIYTMVLPDIDINPRVPCKSSIVPKLDLSQWYEPSFRLPLVSQNITESQISTVNSTPVSYEYHVKTVAVIEGSETPVNISELLNSRYPHTSESTQPTETHKISKRQANETEIFNFFDLPEVDSSNLTKRDLNLPRKGRPKMTQAIMKQKASGSSLKGRSSDDEHDIERFFRTNVPIYDGIPESRSSRYRYQPPRNQIRDEEDDDDDKPMKGLLEVHEEHDSEYELVPMEMDENGKMRVKDEEEKPDFAKFKSQPYKFDSITNYYNGENSPKYGTSHQYNSFAGDQPRYYKHFIPSIKSQDYQSPIGYDNYDSPRLNSHDFTPKRAEPLTHGPYNGNYPRKYTHVPKTLEEYHRLHNTFAKEPKRPHGLSPYHSIPHRTHESSGPHSFVSLNFGSNREEDGLEFTHNVNHHPRYHYNDGPNLESGEHLSDSKYHAARVPKYESDSKYNTDDESIKEFVDSIFKKNKEFRVSPSNTEPDFVPNYGERVTKRMKPAQNVLWHRKAAKDRGHGRDTLIDGTEYKIKVTENVTDASRIKRDAEGDYEYDELSDGSEEDKEETENVEKTAEDEPKAEVNDGKHHDYWTKSYSSPNSEV